MTEQEIRELFAKSGVQLAKTDVWNVQQALVIKHAALERLAAEMGIRWDDPKVLRADREEAVILAKGILVDGEGRIAAAEWSIGEALVGVNYRVSGKQAAYVYAMAEKRAKDRVILKLAKLHGAYSEDEADDFKQVAPSATVSPLPTDATIARALVLSLSSARNPADLNEWFKSNAQAIEALPETLRSDVRDAFAGKKHQLKRNAA